MSERISTPNGNLPLASRSTGGPRPALPFGADVDQAAEKFDDLMHGDDRQPTDQQDENDDETTRKQHAFSPTLHTRVSCDTKKDETDGKLDLGSHHGIHDHSSQNQHSPGDLILQHFAHGDTSNNPVIDTPPPHGPNATDSLDKVAQQIAAQVQVSDLATGREVRIIIRESVLPDTEVRISQDGGRLQVSFFTDSATSHDLIEQNQQHLEQELKQRLGDREIDVSVDARSDGQGEQQEGRSRQRRNVQDEWNEID